MLRSQLKAKFCNQLGRRLWVSLAFFLVLVGSVAVADADQNEFPTQMPSAVLGDIGRTTWLLDNGSFLVEDFGPVQRLADGSYITSFPDKRNMSIIVYKSNGDVAWQHNFEKHISILSVKEQRDNVYELLFEHKRPTDTKIFGYYDNGNSFFYGTYQLFRCSYSGNCQIVKTFEQGVLQIAAHGDFLWALEYKFLDIHSTEFPPLVPWMAQLSQYSIETLKLTNSSEFEGLSSIDIGPEGQLFGEFLFNKAGNRDQNGIFQLIDQSGTLAVDRKRIGGSRPHGDYMQSCYEFMVLPSTGETLCEIATPLTPKVHFIRSNGTFTREIASRIYPKHMPDGGILVANKIGQIMEIHTALGE